MASKASTTSAKQISDPVERAKALRALRQSKPNGSGGPGSPVRPTGNVPPRPVSATNKGPAGRGTMPVDRTLGARKRRDHLAPKKSGVDERLLEFQSTSRTIRKKTSQEQGASPSPNPGDSSQAAFENCPESSDAGEVEPAVVGDEDGEDTELRAELRGDGEDWMVAIQRREAEAQAAREEEERRAAAQRAAAEQEVRAEATRALKEDAQARRRAEEERRALRVAERVEQERREHEDRIRAHEAEVQAMLQATPVEHSPSRTAERSARKARIAEIVSRVKSVNVEDAAVPAI